MSAFPTLAMTVLSLKLVPVPRGHHARLVPFCKLTLFSAWAPLLGVGGRRGWGGEALEGLCF